MADRLVMIDIVEGEVVTCLLVRCSHLSFLALVCFNVEEGMISFACSLSKL